MASRLIDPNPVYRDDNDVPVAGGKLVFSITETSTAKNVYTDSGLGTSLGSEVDLDASGRAEVDIWLASDVLYRMRLMRLVSVGVYEQVWSRDDIGDANVGGLVPLDPADGNDGDVYRTDGVDPYWGPISEVPDNTGHSGKYLTNDGSLNFWAVLQSYSSGNLPGGLVDGGAASGYLDFGNIRVQWGPDTAPTASGITTSKAVTFGQVFATAPWFIGITPSVQDVTTETTYPSASYASPSTTGFTAHFICPGENAGPGSTDIDVAITFTWFAVGPKPA